MHPSPNFSMSLQCSFDDLTITFICHLCSYTTATPVTMPTTTPPTPAPMDQYIALQSLASKTVAAAQTGRMASLINLDILSVEVTDPEPPRELPKGWKRATPADGNYYFGGARSKGFATLRNVSKLQFFDKIRQAKSVGFRLCSAI